MVEPIHFRNKVKGKQILPCTSALPNAHPRNVKLLSGPELEFGGEVGLMSFLWETEGL